MEYYKAEYIWIDGAEPTSKLRSKCKIVEKGEEPPIWGFDGSSTNQATGENSDCVLRPVYSCQDPIRGGDNKLVMCEVLLSDMTPHPSNTRAACVEAADKYADFDTWFGIEQEYTFFDGIKPLGWPENGFPAPQGGYYCGVGADEVFGRPIVEAHMDACLNAGLGISGINGEVMPAQWSSRSAHCLLPSCATSFGSPAGCSIASERTSTSPTSRTGASVHGSTPSPCRVTGMAQAPIATSPRDSCAIATTPASPPLRH